MGLHFFNPGPALALVEVIPSLLTADDVTARVTAFATETLGKHAIIAPDREEFTANALLILYLLAAIRMLEQGLASAEDIDQWMEKGCERPIGPLALADLVGPDTVLACPRRSTPSIANTYSPPLLLMRLVSVGLLGRKTGRGLYGYDP